MLIIRVCCSEYECWFQLRAWAANDATTHSVAATVMTVDVLWTPSCNVVIRA